jgi:5-oxoprolinase (ATP-hydrolysing)
MARREGPGPWRFWVDRGGTFTDVVARAPDGAIQTLKLLSEDPGRYADAAVEAIRRLTGGEGGPAELRLGTTVATNALLERRGEPVLLVVTQGFADMLRIGTQERPELFAREIVLPEPIYADVLEVVERIAADGQVLTPLDEAAARAGLAAARARGLASVAIVLMHGWAHPAHEAALARLAVAAGFAQISVSHRIAPVQRIVPRGDTTVADAFLSPVLRRYVAGLEAGLRAGQGAQVAALYMQSGGTLAEGSAFSGKDAVLSGPAGGNVALADVARVAGAGEVVGFDMGGTSTDVSHYAGRFERDSQARIEGVRLAVPMLRVHTVAAGGGSICGFAHGRLFVGPRSAGALPGPACYRRGGPLTVTDCNLLLGRLQPAHFPAIDIAPAAARIDEVIAASGLAMSREAAAQGFLDIAVTHMAQAIKAVSLRRGRDVTRAALVSFGGAGGQHACAVAEALGMGEVLVHPLASLLSAWGMGLARRGALREATLALPLAEGALAELAARIAALGEEARAALAGEIEVSARVTLRPAGSDNGVEVDFGTIAAMREAFAAGWRARFGYAPGMALVVESVRVEAVAREEPVEVASVLPTRSAPPLAEVVLWRGGAWPAPLYERESLAAGGRAGLAVGRRGQRPVPAAADRRRGRRSR